LPSHTPLVEQAATPRSLQVLRGSGAPLATFKHCPGELARLQLRQGPVQLFSQQTPSTHWPESHSLEAEQGCPIPRGPHSPVVTPFMVWVTHWFPGRQSVSLVQILIQAPLVHWKGLHSRTPEFWQLPLPSQVRWVFSTEPAQEEGPHTVFSGKSVHEPEPSQRPVLPQVVRSLAWHAGSGKPAGMDVQWPTDPVWLHDTQEPVHPRLQHTPSTQKPEIQSSLTLQTLPLMLLPQLPATHCCPTAHWALVVQVEAQWLVAGSQLQGGQISDVTSEHWPLPSQERTPVTPSPSQVPALHSVSFTHWRQLRLPSQVPSSPQVAGLLAGQSRGWLGFPPAGTGAHSPRELARLQAMQVS